MIKKCALWLRDSFIRSRSLNATRIVAGSFAAIILIGALLLTLPIASRDGQSAGFFTGLFTATSSTCVTGLILVDTWTQWTLFGQAVILTMIQLGGLGFMTVITLVSFALHRRIGLSERLIMVSTLNLNDMDGVVRVVRQPGVRQPPPVVAVNPGTDRTPVPAADSGAGTGAALSQSRGRPSRAASSPSASVNSDVRARSKAESMVTVSRRARGPHP